MLEKLLGCNAKFISLARIALFENHTEKIIIQKDPLEQVTYGKLDTKKKYVRYPVTLMNKNRFEEILSKKYSIKAIFKEEDHAYCCKNKWAHMFGYFAERSY